jgi:RNA polymerase sigma-70 factor, ECF subfamily
MIATLMKSNTMAQRDSSSSEQERALELVENLKQGKDKAFDALFQMYQRRIFNLSLRMLGDPEEASDLTQDIFVKLYRSVHQFRKQSSFYTWLYRIAINTCKNRLEKTRRQAQFETAYDDGLEATQSHINSSSNAPLESVQRLETREAILNAVSKLPEKAKTILILKDFQSFNYEEISQILECSTGTVKSRLSRARAQLRERLSQDQIFQSDSEVS